MSDLSSIEKMKFEKLLDMSSGYVLNFSNRSFEEFIFENIGINIYDSRFSNFGTSKANRLRAFWKTEPNLIVSKLMLRLLEYWKAQKDLNNQPITFEENKLYKDCFLICNRLQGDTSIIQQADEEKKRDTIEIRREQLLRIFDELANSNDFQKRGYLLQELLTKLFELNNISVIKSFQRNGGGEQIDGAFIFDGWHYLVECKWTKKLSDIRELDSLLGKVNRSGKQMMGLFVSIDGWSENVPFLLKQNPEKCIILMDGYDLRSILSGAIDLDKLLRAKLAKLNFDSEPFYSVVEILKENK